MSKRGKEIPSSYFDDDDDIKYRRRQTKQPVSTFDEFVKSKEKSSRPTRELSMLDRIAIGIIIVLMAFWTLAILTTTLALKDPMIFMGVLMGALVYWGITWIVYYVGWKFYWILIALGWLLGTGYALTIMGVLTQSLTRLFR